MATKATTKKEKNCKNNPTMDIDDKDRKGLKSDLIDASGGNIIYKVLKESTSPDDMANVMAEKALNAGFLIPKAGPLVTGFILLGIYSICCCWTACPCCKFCLCCRKKRKIHIVAKLIALGLVVGIILGLLISAMLSMRGFNAALSGFEVTNCAAAKVVDSAFNGQSSPLFVGLIPTLETFQDLRDNLDASSAFITSVKTTISKTAAITEAVTVASGTMKLLRDMMADPANKKPMSLTNKDLLHECQLCGHLESALTPAIQALDDGIGTALDGARTEVNKQLSGSQLDSLRDSMTTASEPIIQLKMSMKSAFGPFVTNDSIEGVQGVMSAWGVLASVALILFALLLSFCGGSAVAFWICLEKKKSEEGGEAKYRSHTHRCACITWCGGCHYTIFAFIVGGIMIALAIPLASICLVMEDVNGQMLHDISRPLGLDLSTPSGAMMIDMVEQCFRNPDPSANPELLKLIKIETSPGNETTMYQKIVGDTKDMIDSQFSKITDKMGSGMGSQKLNDDPNIIKLKDMLKNTRMSSMMLPTTDIATGSNAATYGAMAADNDLKPYFASSADCFDFTIPAGLPKAGDSIFGVTSFFNELKNFGVAQWPPRSTCARSVVCSDPLGVTARGAACKSANALMDLKHDLRSQKIFKCRKFQHANGNTCDVKFMAKSFGSWTSDCMVNGQVTQKTYACGLDEFTALVQDFETRFDKVFKRLDDSVVVVMDDISTGLRSSVNQYIINPITTVADGLTCGFLGAAYQSVLDGLCYGGVWGFRAMATSYVFCACMTLLLSILMYIVWRLALDNVKAVTEDKVEKYEGGEGSAAEQ
eukprot:TRINITY_DN37884_c0_g1_i1.p1 TRINITY_DN37884_c0_g1~~TRINITY_DN37884_c0_g1_i1.p1  ORF type:complete len:878 (+),score=170.69 TRINITY_DN37884_c0_g1_i1:175-2634(+)